VPDAVYQLSMVGSVHAQAEGCTDPAGLPPPAGHALHADAAVSSPKVPTGHVWHVGLTAAAPKVPTGQSEQLLDRASLVRPVPQLTQSASVTLPLDATS
jgi:hypothetical protein